MRFSLKPLTSLAATIAFLLLSIISFSQDIVLPEQAKALLIRGSELSDIGEYEEAISSFEGAKAIIKDLVGEDSTDLGNCLNNIGVCYENLNDYSKALEYHLQSLEIRKRVDLNDHPDYVINSLGKVGICYYSLGNYNKALEYDLEALEYSKTIPNYTIQKRITLLDIIAEDYCSLDDYEQALKIYQVSLELTEKELGKDHPDYAICLINVGDSYVGLDEFKKAIKIYEQALTVLERKSPQKQNPDYSSTLHSIGNCYLCLDDFSKALEYYKRALAIYEGEEDTNATPDLIVELNAIGVCYFALDDYHLAIDYYLRELEVIDQESKNLPEYADIFSAIGLCFKKLGDYEKALSYYQQALAHYEKASVNDSSGCVPFLYNIGDCFFQLEDYAKALDSLQPAYAIIKNNGDWTNPDCFDMLWQIGVCYYVLCDYDNSLAFYSLALDIAKKNEYRGSSYAPVLNLIGDCYRDLGEQDKALDYYNYALDLYKKEYGKRNQYYAGVINDIGRCYRILGVYDKALDYHKQALSIYKSVFGNEHESFAGVLNEIGICYSDCGDYENALDYFKDALAVFERIYGDEYPDCASILNNIGICYSYIGDNSKALDCFQRTLELFELHYGKDNLDYSVCLQNIGNCYRFFGDQSKALDFYLQALATKDKILGKENQDYAKTLFQSGLCYLNLRRNEIASESFISYAKITTNIVTRSFSFLTEHQRAQFWELYGGFYTDNLFDIASYLSTPEIKRAAYNGALLGKGLLLNAEIEMRKLILESGDEEVLRLYNKVQDDRVKLDKTYKDPNGKKTLIDSLNNDIEKRQQELMKRSKAFGDFTRYLAPTWSDVQSVLGRDDIAIEFETYTHKDTTFYIALTLRPGYTEPHLVELFNSIELKRIKPSRYYTSSSMTDLIWGNLSEELKGVKNIFFSPVGELNNIGIEYLLDKDGRHLFSEKRSLYRITSTRELTAEGKTEPIKYAVLYGGIRYDSSPSRVPSNKETKSEGLTRAVSREIIDNNTAKDSFLIRKGFPVFSAYSIFLLLICFLSACIVTRLVLWIFHNRCVWAKDWLTISAIIALLFLSLLIIPRKHNSPRFAFQSRYHLDSLSLTRGNWVYLPGTKEEVDAISIILTSNSIESHLLEGEDGTEESFKAQSGENKDVIHIATHGFYWTEIEAARSNMETSSFMLDGDNQVPKEDKALTRSGLLFAGAQNAFEGKDIPIDVEDGILTAKEISKMDLRGTDLVVISACQSGLGEVTGDGVFGLQRGFKKAGVQSIVMSLWEVSDEATKIMMTRFYENLAKGRSKYDSFRDAQNYLRKYDGGLYDEPEYYAAFVLLDAIK